MFTHVAEIEPLWEPCWGPSRALAAWILPALLVLPIELGSEDYRLQTYFPAPLGVYSNLTTTADTSLARDGGRVTIGASAVGGGTLTVNGNQINSGYLSATGNLTTGAGISAGTAVMSGNTSIQPNFLSTPGYIYAGAGTLYSGYAVYTPGNAYVKDVYLASVSQWADALSNNNYLAGFCWLDTQGCGTCQAGTLPPASCVPGTYGAYCSCPSGYTSVMLNTYSDGTYYVGPHGPCNASTTYLGGPAYFSCYKN